MDIVKRLGLFLRGDCKVVVELTICGVEEKTRHSF
jgi:hypothetical protein